MTKSGVTVRKRQNSTLKSLSLYAPEDAYDANFLTNYMKINIEPQMSRIAGVGEVNIWGASYSMRIWLDPLKMAQYHLVPADISTVLAEQNVESPTGTLGAESTNTFQYVLKYRGRYEEERDYENMVIKSLPNGDVLRLKDVARVELGAENYALLSQTDGHPGANCMIAQTSGSNANEIIKEIDATAAEISTDLPKGMVLADIMSTKDFLDASIANVIETLLLAIVLVIGTVVDNAIVVVETVQAKFDEGVVVACGLLIGLMGITKTGLVPQEDMGTINVNVQTAPGSSLEETERVMDEIYRRTDGIKAAQIRVSTQPMISSYGTSDGFELYVQDKKGGSVEELLKYTNGFIDALNQRPEISRAYTTFDTKYPQFQVDVNAARCKRNGVSPTDVLNTLAGYIGGSYSSNLNRFTKLYRVMVQAAWPAKRPPPATPQRWSSPSASSLST